MILDYMYLRVVATYRIVQITQPEFMEQDGRRFRRDAITEAKGKSLNGESGQQCKRVLRYK